MRLPAYTSLSLRAVPLQSAALSGRGVMMRSKHLLISLVVLAVVVACGSGGDDQAETSSSPTATLENQTPTISPSPSPAETEAPTVNPEAAFIVWKDSFGGTSDDFTTLLADVIEESFYWVDSVDRATYDKEANLLVIDATIAFESVYTGDPQEWRDRTWSLYSGYAREIWDISIEGFEASSDYAADWARWTPGMLLNGNVGRLTVSCPGDLIYRVQQRDATQAEFQTECAFTP